MESGERASGTYERSTKYGNGLEAHDLENRPISLESQKDVDYFVVARVRNI
jgi:hypothetical protein